MRKTYYCIANHWLFHLYCNVSVHIIWCTLLAHGRMYKAFPLDSLFNYFVCAICACYVITCRRLIENINRFGILQNSINIFWYQYRCIWNHLVYMHRVARAYSLHGNATDSLENNLTEIPGDCITCTVSWIHSSDAVSYGRLTSADLSPEEAGLFSYRWTTFGVSSEPWRLPVVARFSGLESEPGDTTGSRQNSLLSSSQGFRTHHEEALKMRSSAVTKMGLKKE